MKKSGFCLWVLVLVLFVNVTFAQKNINEYKVQENKELLEIATIKDNSGWIQFQSGKNIDPLTVFESHKSAFGLKVDDAMQLFKTEKDKLGDVHYRYQQYYKGVPVEGSQYIVHSTDGKATNANGKTVVNLNLDISPTISSNQAITAALKYIGAEKYMWEDEGAENLLKRIKRNTEASYYPVPELLVMDKEYSFNSVNYKLVYKLEIRAQKPLVRKFIFIDAKTGLVYHSLNMIQNTEVQGVAITKYNGAQLIMTDSVSPGLYRLAETSRGNGIETYNMQTSTEYGTAVDFTDDDNFWDVTTNQDDAATNAHWASEMTYDYYLTMHGRHSYDDNDATLISFVHYDVNYDNAFWNGEFMTYGDGSGQFTALTSLDVCGHEITHGVTEFSANLVYQDEPGAMNESMSDIFGACIEFFADSINPDWLVGEDFDNSGAGFRDMSNPQANGDPDTYHGNGWIYDPNYDNGGVHINSGVGNYWFYLMTEGGSGTNDNGNVYNVAGLGMDVAAQIAYRALTVYLSATSQYADFRLATLQAAEDLYGNCSLEVIETSKAWFAVGVGFPIENYDLGLREITSPLTACGLGNEEVSIVLLYNGCDVNLNIGDTVYVGYSLDGGTDVNDTIILASPMQLGDTLVFTFPELLDASVVGVHSLHCWVDYPMDSANYNDEINNYLFEHILQQNIDVGVVSIIAPVPSCQLGDEMVEIEIGFFGCDSLAAGAVITVAYQVDDSPIVYDTIITDSVIYSYETFTHVFSTFADLSIQGTNYTIDAWTSFPPDSLTSNDAVNGYILKNPVSIKGQVVNFENSNATNACTIIETNVQSMAQRSSAAENTGIFGFLMSGGDDPMSYIDLIDNLDTAQLWTQLWPFIAKVTFCVDASELADLNLSFDLKQTFSSIYESYMGAANPNASTLRILINDEQLGDYFNPTTEHSDPYLTHVINLDSLAGTHFQLTFQSLAFIGHGYEPIPGVGTDDIFLDNIFFTGTKILETSDTSDCIHTNTTVIFDVIGNVSNPTQSQLSVIIDQTPSNGTAIVNGDSTITYTPATDFSGMDTIAYSVSLLNDPSVFVSALIVVSVNPLLTSLNETICLNDSIMFGGSYISTAAVYYDSLTNGFGCDSIVELTLTVNSLPVIDLGENDTILQDGLVVLDAGTGYSTYLWSNGAATQTLVVDSNLIGVGNHVFSVMVTNSNNCSSSDSVVVTMNQGYGIHELANSSINIYPNPNNGVFYIDFSASSNKNLKVEIYDLPGRKIASSTRNIVPVSDNTMKIDISKEPKGIYICKITSGKDVYVQKIVFE